MTVLSYHSTLIGDVASEEAVDTTSSQIFLSRGVARSGSKTRSSSEVEPSIPVTSIYESATSHVMTIGDAACSSVSEEVEVGQPTHTVDNASSASSEASNQVSPGSSTQEGHHRLNLFDVAPSGRMFNEKQTTTPPQSSSTPSSSESLGRTRIIDKGKTKKFDRGRPLERGPRFPNPLSRAESGPRGNAAIEVDARPIKQRTMSRSNTFFEDPTDPCAVLEDNLLEPCPRMHICSSVSEVLLKHDVQPQLPASLGRGLMRRATSGPSSTLLDKQTMAKPNRALTTAFNDCRPLHPAPTLPPEMISPSLPDISHLEYLAIKSSSHTWENPRSAKRPRSEPKALWGVQLPTEIIQQIFYHLPPADFNSARHTCRLWFIASLEREILRTMFKRGGWASSIQLDTAKFRSTDTANSVNDEWFLSKHLARECALSADWTGNGIDTPARLPSSTKKSSFVPASTIDFSDVAVHYPGPNSSGTIFTVSSCGKFVMAANGCLVYIYEINRSHRFSDDPETSLAGSLRPVTSVICPRRVLACSMDTSSQRYAIAILLDGRMGLVCDISPHNINPIPSGDTSANSNNGKSSTCPIISSDHVHDTESCRGPSFLDRVSLNSSASTHSSCIGRTGSEPRSVAFVFPGIAATGPGQQNASSWQDVYADDMSETARTAGPSSRHPSLPRPHKIGPGSRLTSCLPPHSEQQLFRDSMPVETGPRSVYRNLCSDDDPPRSVAICPQRRCVAFGCSAGIELHWVDALTGQDLNRWFPLTAPSDYLFFLPPRKSVDSAKKLRLISSSAKPGERAAITHRAFGGKTKNSPFWNRSSSTSALEDEADASSSQFILSRLRGEGVNRRLSNRMMDGSDHYRAVPLSDGYHILFTDPATGLLCLGSDAPVGGPTKLLRKIWFQGPEGKGSPITYSGGTDLSWGVRVVAAYGTGDEQIIWFFSVPADVFAANQGPQTLVASSWLRASSITESRYTDWMLWWPDDGLQEWLNHAGDPVAGILPRSVWPVKIRGQEIGKCSGLVDLAVDSGPIMTIWAFSKEGFAKVWKIDDGKREPSDKYLVARDGTIRAIDSEGDVEMSDSSSLPTPDILEPPLPLAPETFDGADSYTPSEAVPIRSARRYRMQWVNDTSESDADVLMENLPGRGSSGSFEAVAFIHRRGGNTYTTALGEYESYESIEDDLVEVLTGVARIDIEIR